MRVGLIGSAAVRASTILALEVEHDCIAAATAVSRRMGFSLGRPRLWTRIRRICGSDFGEAERSAAGSGGSSGCAERRRKAGGEGEGADRQEDRLHSPLR